MSWQYTSGSDPNAKGAGIPFANPNNIHFSDYGDIDEGYYVKLPDSDPANKFPSGYLQQSSKNATYLPPDAQGNPARIDLWITQAQISLQLNGSFAQSPRLRQFFPRNFVQPVWNITGIVPNSFQLQRLAEFIRRSHFDALNPTGITTNTTSLITFVINAGNLGNLANIASIAPDTLKQLTDQQQNYLTNNPNAIQGKGPHAAQIMQGYIGSFTRGAERFINVPTFEFDFTVAFSSGDLLVTQNWADSSRYVNLPAITTALLGTGQTNKVQPPNTG